jgi:hypothetical protein
VTGAEYIDVKFTVVVGYALMFAVNMFLLGALLPDLRPSAREAKNHRIREEMVHKDDTAEPPGAGAGTNTTATVIEPAVKSPQAPLPKLSVKSLIRNGTRSCVTLQSEKDTRTIFLGDSELVQTTNGPCNVHFDGLTDEFVLLSVGEQKLKLPAR